MDTSIIAAIIGAVGVVTAAVVAHVMRRKKMHKEEKRETAPQNAAVVDNRIQAGGDVIVSGRDTHVTQPSNDRFMTKKSSRLVSKVADEIIKDRHIRFDWSSFDARFLDTCFRDTPRGWIFDGAASKKWLNWDNDQFFDLGVRIYNEVCNRLGYSHADYKNLALVAETYVSARYLLRGLTIIKHPKKEVTVEDFHTLWDGSEPGWCLVKNVRDEGIQEPFSPVIFNRKTKGALMIDDLPLLREVIARMKEADVSEFSTLESAVGSKCENMKSRETTEDATALIHCECGTLIMVTDIPIPPPRHFHVRCKKCGTEKDVDLDNCASLRIDE
jgi:hypothetical protein